MADEIEAEVSDPTTGRRTGSRQRMQIVARMAAKRSWTLGQKIAILDEAFALAPVFWMRRNGTRSIRVSSIPGGSFF